MDPKYEALFTPWKIGNVEIKNRIVMLPMEGTNMIQWEVKTGFVKGIEEFYRDRKDQHIGLFIPGLIPLISIVGKKWVYNHPEVFEQVKPVVKEIHDSGAKIFFQISAGSGRSMLLPPILKPFVKKGFLKTISSPFLMTKWWWSAPDPDEPNVWDPEVAMDHFTKDMIRQFVYAFGQTAKLCRDAGVDGVEIHAVHEGYLLDQFAMPYTNHREDEYGGSLENRLRFACEIVREIKKVCGADYPVSIRYSVCSMTRGFNQGAVPGEEFTEAGRTMEESEKAIRILEEAGYDMFNCDNGTYDAWYWAHPPVYAPLNMNLPYVEHIKPFIKKCLRHINSPNPLIHEGVAFCATLFHNSGMNILQKIFTDHYEEMVYTLHPRGSVIENVEKMINCGDPSYGGAMYACPKCGNYKYVPFRCHSRFCPTCGNKYSMERTTNMSFKLINVTHRHCVFTIDENLRHFFLEDRSLLSCLFHAVTSVVTQMFYRMNKSKNFTPGFIMVLHTFGRDLKWNPHIHCLISEGGYSDDGFWRNVKHFNYTFLRNAFRTALLNELEAHLGPSFKKTKASCYKEHEHGFYVYAKPNKCDPKVVTKYIGRYLGRPVIATSRIDKYDGEYVTFHYNRHEDDVYVEETIPVMEFIERLIRHIPEKHFKMIRYGGLYARHRAIDKKLHHAISRDKRKFFLSFHQWRNAILLSFGYDPLKCACGATMLRIQLYFKHKPVSLQEMYEKAMSRYRGKSSSP